MHPYTGKNMDIKNALTLKELLLTVKKGVEGAMPFPVWVSAEIAEIKQRSSGHCYMELIDDSGAGARAQAVIWNSNYRVIAPYFENETGRSLGPGMKILVKIQVSYSELYSLTLSVTDIEPSFSVGEVELERRRTVRRLEEEGMFGMNGTLRLPRLPRRFAVVSSETAAGYRDFMKHLHENQYGFRFYTELFPAVMQGREAPVSIVSAMERAALRENEFDALVLLRGGGSGADLSCFDDYWLSVNVAQFPLPVITGIGHDHDNHICDMVAAYSVKTPTAIADLILDCFISEDARLESLAVSLRQAVGMKFMSMEAKLDMLEQRLQSSAPENILKKGYVLLLDDSGRRFSSVEGRSEGERISVMMSDGVLGCRVESVERNGKNQENGKNKGF